MGVPSFAAGGAGRFTCGVPVREADDPRGPTAEEGHTGAHGLIEQADVWSMPVAAPARFADRPPPGGPLPCLLDARSLLSRSPAVEAG